MTKSELETEIKGLKQAQNQLIDAFHEERASMAESNSILCRDIEQFRIESNNFEKTQGLLVDKVATLQARLKASNINNYALQKLLESEGKVPNE